MVNGTRPYNTWRKQACALHRGLVKEAIHGSVEYDPQYAPATSDYEPAEYESQKEGDSLAINLQPAEPQHTDFDDPTDQ